MSLTQEQYSVMEERIKVEISKAPCNASFMRCIIIFIIDDTTNDTLEYGASWELAGKLVRKCKAVVQDIFRVNMDDTEFEDTIDKNIVIVLHDVIHKELPSIINGLEQD